MVESLKPPVQWVLLQMQHVIELIQTATAMSLFGEHSMPDCFWLHNLSIFCVSNTAIILDSHSYKISWPIPGITINTIFDL